MGQYTRLLQIDPAELTDLKAEGLYRRFYPDGTISGVRIFDLDKSLPGITFLLSGSTNPDNVYQNLLKDGIALSAEQEDSTVTYHVMTPGEIAAVNQLLSFTDDSTLEQNFDPLAMTLYNVYPDIWNNGKESYDYLHTHFTGLRQFISIAAKDSRAIIVMTT